MDEQTTIPPTCSRRAKIILQAMDLYTALAFMPYFVCFSLFLFYISVFFSFCFGIASFCYAVACLLICLPGLQIARLVLAYPYIRYLPAMQQTFKHHNCSCPRGCLNRANTNKLCTLNTSFKITLRYVSKYFIFFV